MGKNKNNGHDDDDKIVPFPVREERGRINRQKAKVEKETKKREKKEKKDRSQKEEQWRAQYRAEQARKQSHMAQKHASGKQPFFNFDRIPLFTRLSVGSFLVIQLIVSLLLEPEDRLELFSTLGFVPGAFTGAAPLSALAFISPITSLFIHGGWMHLAFNLVMMLAMGVFFEKQFGFKRTALFFLACGLAGNLFYFLFSPSSIDPVIGASGAISGLFAAAILLMNEHGMLGQVAAKRGVFPFILIWLVLIILTGMISTSTAWQSHLGGFLGGLGLYHLWKKGFLRF